MLKTSISLVWVLIVVCLGVDYVGEHAVLHRLSGDLREVAGAGVVLAVVETGRVLEVGVLEAQLLRLAVHLLHRVLHAGLAAPAAHVLGQGVDRLGAGGDQGGERGAP